ncbi:DUF6279 family lipoprotein [Nitrospira sp. KM1]|uniref:DUF6279 family lipoprotein n=1 Tax=Nitrospira sp. KM1 TaxID=1936990 RepID=UPI0015638183|nr:DUF6279 family lipoprotein [Nitrospira sp. KM1]
MITMMMRRSIKVWNFILIALVFLGLTGCATSLLYNHAGWLLTQQLDGYFDLSKSQKKFVSSRLESILDRHRHEALPRYESLLLQVEDRIRRGLTRDDIAWGFAQFDQLKTDLFTRFAGDGGEFIRLVNDQQIPRLRRSLHQRLSREEALLRDGAQARQVKRAEKLVSIAKDWLGSLTREQEQIIIRLSMDLPDTLPAWYAHQSSRNSQLVAIVEQRSDPRIQERLSEWLVDQEKYADPTFLLQIEQLRQQTAGLILAIDRVATSEQRHHAIAKLNDLALTIHALSRA